MRSELLELTNGLPAVYNNVAELSKQKEILEAYDYYKLFVNFTVNLSDKAKRIAEENPDAKTNEEDQFAVWKYIVEHGNETVWHIIALYYNTPTHLGRS